MNVSGVNLSSLVALQAFSVYILFSSMTNFETNGLVNSRWTRVIENKYGIYVQLKLAYGYLRDALPGLADVGGNEYGQVIVKDTSYKYVLTEADVKSFSETNIMMIFGHNVILKKITVK